MDNVPGRPIGMAYRYFCHQCTRHIRQTLPQEFRCPFCNSEFVEELPRPEETRDGPVDVPGAENSITAMNDPYFAQFLRNIYGQFNGSEVPRQPGHALRSGAGGLLATSASRRPEGHSLGAALGPAGGFGLGLGAAPGSRAGQQHVRLMDGNLEEMLHSLMSLVAGRTQARGGGIINIDIPIFQILHGNLGDYAWGSEGLDAVVTQLLNQLDASGPPPMPKNEIDKIPQVKISSEQVAANLQCTVCMEDFHLDESVRQLQCQHVFHHDCIIPWLEMHGTCPICRKILNKPDNSGSSSSASAHNQAGTSRNQQQQQQQPHQQQQSNSTNSSATTEASVVNNNNHRNSAPVNNSSASTSSNVNSNPARGYEFTDLD